MRLAAVLVLVACGHPAHVRPAPSAGVPWAASGVDWSTAPAIRTDPRLLAPPIEAFELANGMHVLLVENHRLPIVELSTIHAQAGSREDGGRPGLAAFTVDLLDEGAGKYTAGELANALDREGARLELRIATDYASAQLVTLSEHLPASLDLLADVLERPRFSEADVARIRTARVADLAQHLDRPRTIAAQSLDRLLFGAHAYGRPAEGIATEVGKLTAADALAFWKASYTPNTTTLIATGDVTRQTLEKLLAHSFGDWPIAKGGPADRRPGPENPPTLGFVDRPGAPNAVVLIGRRAETGTDLSADVANLVLGGTATARLDRKLRGELGITLGAGSSFWRGQLGGTWAVAMTMPARSTAEGIRATLALIEMMRSTDVPADELAQAKLAMRRAIAQAFETTAGTVRALEHIVVQHLPIDHYATYEARLDAVTPASARAAITPLWTDLTIVVVGDWSVIGDGLRSLGLPPIAIAPTR
jgi:zinc protease